MNSHLRKSAFFASAAFAVLIIFCVPAFSDDGYRLWLRYDKLSEQQASSYRTRISSLVVTGNSATLNAIRAELTNGLNGLLGESITITGKADRDGAIVVGTPKSSSVIAGLKLDNQLSALGNDGFIIRSVTANGHRITVIASNGETGALYGAFHFLRLLQTLQPVASLHIRQKPRIQLRMLDHWDNLDGSIERGYAGKSLWKWSELPGTVDPRYKDYARASSSIGVNGAVLNNVNANSIFLTAEYLKKVAAIADGFRPYGIKVYLSPRFSAPMELDGLKTADPLDPEVVAWWKK